MRICSRKHFVTLFFYNTILLQHTFFNKEHLLRLTSSSRRLYWGVSYTGRLSSGRAGPFAFVFDEYRSGVCNVRSNLPRGARPPCRDKLRRFHFMRVIKRVNMLAFFLATTIKHYLQNRLSIGSFYWKEKLLVLWYETSNLVLHLLQASSWSKTSLLWGLTKIIFLLRPPL